ncbi:hypothetical protein N9O57_00155 [bacterium]|nr:hypothetical protein [bacterium]
MKVSEPVFYLDQLCPECEQGNSLVPCKCPQCETVVLKCVEEGSIFINLKDVNSIGVLSPLNFKCPGCDNSDIDSFISCTGDEIKKSGLSYH